MNPTANTRTRPAVAAPTNRSVFGLVDFLCNTAKALEACRRRHKASRQFTRIDQRILRDIGISEAQRFLLSEK
jgi:uncharacterized protein YjiS (DUF1127 family)